MSKRGFLALALAWACGGGSEPAPPAPVPAPEPAPTEFRTDAHVAAYERLRPLAKLALDYGDPITAAQLDGGPPAPLPFSPGARAVLRKAIDAAWAEAEDIDSVALGLERATLLRTIRFALARLRDEHVRRPSTRTDPAVGLRATALLLDDLERRGPDCDGCDAALGQAAVGLQTAVADLGASSLARAQAAAVDCEALRERLRVLLGDAATRPGAALLLAAIGEAAGRIGAMAGALEHAQPQAAPERIAIAKDPAQALRLPDRMGAAALRRWLDVQESEPRKADALVAELGRALVQLDALAGKDAAAAPPTAEPTAIDAARCEAAWRPIAAWAKTQPALAAAALDCGEAMRRLPARGDDVTLVLALVQLGVVEPTELAQRRRVDPLLARVGGRIAPAAHRHALAIAALSGLRRTDARARALAAARDDICLAITALWIHGELGDDAALATVLGSACAGRPLAAWTADALARPERAFAGLGLALLGLGPADAVALEQFWWAPIGLVVPLARPSTHEERPVAIHTEPIGPGAEAQP